MTHDIVNTMQSLREEMRQRLLQAPEYRALEALDRSIEEICAIMRETAPLSESPRAAPAPLSVRDQPSVGVVVPVARPAPAARHGAIASAFAETLAAKIDQRPGSRPSAPFPLAARAGG
jgi:hypothetical protein